MLPSAYLCIKTEPTASRTEEEKKFSEGINDNFCCCRLSSSRIIAATSGSDCARLLIQHSSLTSAAWPQFFLPAPAGKSHTHPGSPACAPPTTDTPAQTSETSRARSNDNRRAPRESSATPSPRNIHARSSTA